jgi:hypothetical protein
LTDVTGHQPHLIEASGIHRVERWGNMHLQTKGLDIGPNMIGVLEQGGAIPNLNYRGRVGTYNNSWNNNFHWRFNVSYITGSHAQGGRQRCHRPPRKRDLRAEPAAVRFLNGVPNQITQHARQRAGGCEP